MNHKIGDQNHQLSFIDMSQNETLIKKDGPNKNLSQKLLNRSREQQKLMTQAIDVSDEEILKKLNNKITTVFQMRKKALAESKNLPNTKANLNHYCIKCQCGGTSECTKKIDFLQGKIRQMTNNPYKKQVIQIYDIEKLGIQNQHYLIQYNDNTMQKVSAKYLKKNYLKSYVQFLQSKCFSQFRH